MGCMVGAACGTDKVGSYRSRPLRGIGVVLWCEGGLNGEGRWKASPYFHRKVGPYDVHTISIQ